jgi:hypothetical protein
VRGRCLGLDNNNGEVRNIKSDRVRDREDKGEKGEKGENGESVKLPMEERCTKRQE